MPKIKYDFSGWVTKYNVPCTDGKTIQTGAFKHMDGKIVPLIFQHGHEDQKNVLGKIELEHREKGVYGYASFNDTQAGKDGKIQVEHGDLTMFSVYANQVKAKVQGAITTVIHGMIREASLVLSGANPEARIDNVIIAHADGYEETSETEITMTSGSLIEVFHEDKKDDDQNETTLEDIFHSMTEVQQDFLCDVAEGKIDLTHADEKTLGEIFQSMNQEQKDFVFAIAAQIAADDVQQGEGSEGSVTGQENQEGVEHADEGGQEMNIFEDSKTTLEEGKVLKQSEIDVIRDEFFKTGKLRDSIVAHAGTYGIDSISYLFPEVRVVGDIDIDERKKEWVKVLMAGVNKVPWSRIKSLYADLTEDEARAKGYITGDEKFEEVFGIFSRETDPTTIYSRQKLDNDDIIDIKNNFNVVTWLKRIMDVQLEEEAARAMLIGDGRVVTNKDKIKEDKIRPIWSDDDVYTLKIRMADTVTGITELEQIMLNMEYFEGESPVLFTTYAKMVEWKLLKDDNGNYRFPSIEAIATFLGVRKIVECPVMKGLTADHEATTYDAIGIITDLNGYTVGTNEGGRKKDYEDFDIDFNQHKYLKEGRMSGAQTRIRTSVSIMKAQAAG